MKWRIRPWAKNNMLPQFSVPMFEHIWRTQNLPPPAKGSGRVVSSSADATVAKLAKGAMRVISRALPKKTRAGKTPICEFGEVHAGSSAG